LTGPDDGERELALPGGDLDRVTLLHVREVGERATKCSASAHQHARTDLTWQRRVAPVTRTGEQHTRGCAFQHDLAKVNGGGLEIGHSRAKSQLHTGLIHWANRCGALSQLAAQARERATLRCRVLEATHDHQLQHKGE
jgi:hypothetical protein